MKLIIASLTLLSLHASAVEMIGLCSNPESNVIISKTAENFDLEIMDQTNAPLEGEWYDNTFLLSGKSTGKIINSGVFEGCVELTSLAEDVSDPGLGYALWEMIICMGEDGRDTAFFDATQFQPSDYVYKCSSEDAFKKLKSILK